jgi:hypothetical protein
MATIDRTRSLFEPRKRYAGVRMQQGRVVLDDDHNEGQEVDLEETRRTTLDVIGPSGSPDDGFLVEGPSLSGALIDFTVRAGTIYVGGIPVRLDRDVTFASQPDWLAITSADRSRHAALPRDLVYLEVWQQPVGAEEDRELAEPALGGPDTTMRLRTMARVRRRGTSASSCSGALLELTNALASAQIGSLNSETCELQNDLRLRVSYLAGGVPDDLCSPSVTAGYLGAENQTLRVQLLERRGAVGDGELTWGIDNAAPLYRARRIDATTLELDSLPRDEAHWPLLGQTVEVLPWSAVLISDGDASTLDGEILADGGGRALASPSSSPLSLGGGHLSTLASSYTSSSHRITLSSGLPASFNAHSPTLDTDFNGEARDDVLFVRVWNRGSDLTSPARIPYLLGSPLDLGNTGLQVTITGTDTGADAHWIIAARPHTPDQVYPWNFEDPAGREAQGVRRFVVPLAVISWSGSNGTVHDCRKSFRPLTRLKQCCSFTVGDGETSFGDFTSIQDAIDSLPSEGGEVCVLPGIFREHLKLAGKHDVTIHGCGPRSRLVLASPPEAMVEVRGSSAITLRDLSIETETGWGVQLEEAPVVSGVTLERLRISVRDRGAVVASSTTRLVLRSCEFVGQPLATEPTAGSSAGRSPLVLVQGDDILVEECTLRAEATPSPARRVAGGLQIGGESENVVVRRNQIVGGNGNGITLGHVVTDKSWTFGVLIWVPYWYWKDNCLKLGWTLIGSPGSEKVTLRSGGPLERIFIEDNRILALAGDGIGVAWFFDSTEEDDQPDDIITVRDLRVARNWIEQCNFGEHEASEGFLQGWSGHGPIALAAVEDGKFFDNELSDNGTNKTEPLCGFFILSAQGVVIEQNRITGNGQSGAEYAGYLGGIVLPHVAPFFSDGGEWDGRGAARVVGNRVVAPEGPALSLRASSGSVEVTGNELLTRARLQATSAGIVVDLINGGFLSEDFDLSNGFDGSETPATGGQVVYSRNQVNWLPPKNESTFGLWLTLVLTLDDVALQNNVCRADLPGGDGLLFFDLLAFGMTANIADNRYRERPSSALFSMATLGLLNNTTDNVATHCYYVLDRSTSASPSDGAALNNRSFVHAVAPAWCPQFRGKADAAASGQSRYDEAKNGYFFAKSKAARGAKVWSKS